MLVAKNVRIRKAGLIVACCFVPLLYYLCPVSRVPLVRNASNVKILLVTKGRSGSSLTADIIHAHPGVFYTFEPLVNLMKRRHVEDMEIDAESKAYHMAMYDKEAPELLDHFLHCRFHLVNRTDLANNQLYNSPDSRRLRNCAHSHQMPSCLEDARRHCLSRPHNLVKVIRVRVRPVVDLVLRHDDLRLLYLVRDPRGTLSSQQAAWRMFPWEALREFSAEHCQAVLEDVREVLRLMQARPDKARILCYEALAARPLHVSAGLYRFLGLDFTPEIRQFVFNRTLSGTGGTDMYGTWRGNSTQAAYSWRNKLSFAAAQTIDSNCLQLYKTMGYLPVHSEEELRNSSHSLRIS